MPSNTFADLPMTEKIHRSLGGTPDAPFRDMLSHVDDLASLANGTWAPSSNAEHDALDAYERDFLSRFAYHTTAIEGSTLTPLETELVIEGEFVPSDDKDLRDLFASALAQHREEDLRRQQTCVGPHRDDVTFLISGRDARSFGSQGQQRSVALALKMAEVELAAEILGSRPLLLLDDVMSELDAARRDAVVRFVGRGIQTVITTTNLGYFSPELLDDAEVVRFGAR